MKREQHSDRVYYTRSCEEMRKLYPDGKPLYASNNGYFRAKWEEEFNCVDLPNGATVFKSAIFCPHCGAAIVRYYCDCATAQESLGVQKYGPEFAVECTEARSQRHEPTTEAEFVRLMAQKGITVEEV